MRMTFPSTRALLISQNHDELGVGAPESGSFANGFLVSGVSESKTTLIKMSNGFRATGVKQIE